MENFDSISYALRVAVAKKVSTMLKDKKNIDKFTPKELEEYILINEDDFKKVLKKISK